MKPTKVTTNLLGRVVSLTEDENERLKNIHSSVPPGKVGGAALLVDHNAEVVSVYREDGCNWLTVAISGHGKLGGRLVNVSQDMVTILGKVQGS